MTLSCLRSSALSKISGTRSRELPSSPGYTHTHTHTHTPPPPQHARTHTHTPSSQGLCLSVTRTRAHTDAYMHAHARTHTLISSRCLFLTHERARARMHTHTHCGEYLSRIEHISVRLRFPRFHGCVRLFFSYGCFFFETKLHPSTKAHRHLSVIIHSYQMQSLRRRHSSKATFCAC